MPPKLSVCMTVRDAEETLIWSLPMLDKEWIELIITDHGSVDTTPELIARYATKTERIAADYMLKNGEDKTKNIAIEKATAPWILCLDADERLENVKDMVQLIEKLPAVAEVVLLEHRTILNDHCIWNNDPKSDGWPDKPRPKDTMEPDFGFYVRDPNAHVRLFRKATGIRFSGWMHVEMYYPDGRNAMHSAHLLDDSPFPGARVINHMKLWQTEQHATQNFLHCCAVRLVALRDPDKIRGANPFWFGENYRAELEKYARMYHDLVSDQVPHGKDVSERYLNAK